MKRLSWEQRKSLAGFLSSFAVGWLVTGIVVPSLTSNNQDVLIRSAIPSLIWSSISLALMLWLTQGGKK